MSGRSTQQPTSLTPGIRPDALPKFCELDEYAFQDMCCDLLDAEPHISSCKVYGRRGQTQYGIDLIAHVSDRKSTEVGQCKCCKEFSASEIRKASEEFLKHWDRWRANNVKRFILLVACDLSRTQQQDEVLKQRKRFADLGLGYDVWSAREIRNHLRSKQAIVATYLAPREYWLETICGIVSSPGGWAGGNKAQVSATVDAALVTQVQHLTERLSSDTTARLDRMRVAYREGHRAEAIDWLRNLRDDIGTWRALSTTTRAELLNFEAGVVLDTTGDTAQSQHLAEQALELDASIDQARLRAHIAWRNEGPEAALRRLDGRSDIDSLNLRALILLDMGRSDEALAVLPLGEETEV